MSKSYYDGQAKNTREAGLSHIPDTPEGELICAIIERAVLDLRGEGNPAPPDVESARSFFLSENSLCPDYLRELIIKEFRLNEQDDDNI